MFKAEELKILLEEVEANKGLLVDRFKGAHTNKQKIKKWGEIAERMTALTGITRSDVDVGKKWQDFVSLTKKKASECRQQTNLTGAGVNTAQALNDEEERAMAIIGFSASCGIPGGMDIHAGIPEEGDPSREEWQEEDEPRIAHQSTSAAPTSLPVMTAPSTSATISTPSTASTATASIIVRGCQCSQDLVELEREKVALLRESSERDAHFQKEVIVLKRAKLDLMARQLALEEERFGQQSLSIIIPEQQGNAYFQ